MSVQPVAFNPDGSIDVIFTEKGHSGTLQPEQIAFTTNIDGSENHLFIMLVCPDGCGASSTHPVGGGAAPAEVQRLFVVHAQHNGCPCGAIQAGDTSAAPEAHVRLNVNRMEGPGRWVG